MTYGTVAYEFDQGDFSFKATYLLEPAGEAEIEIKKAGVVVKTFLFPAYKIWNIPAHAVDIVADLEGGLTVAGSDGLGGNVYPEALP